jgi:hypothetical protein
MRETGLSWDEVTKHGGKSRVLEASLDETGIAL